MDFLVRFQSKLGVFWSQRRDARKITKIEVYSS